MELISKWLSGTRNYHIGVILYNQFGKDEKLKKYFSGQPDKIKQGLLVKELTALQQKPAEALLPTINKESGEMPDTSDPVLKALRNEWMPIYKRMQFQIYSLDNFTGNSKEAVAQRHTIAKEILSLEQECMSIWEKRDYYLKKGELPSVRQSDDDIPTDPIALGKLIENLKRNIRRNKQLSEQHPDIADYALRVQKYQEQLDNIINKQNDKGPGQI